MTRPITTSLIVLLALVGAILLIPRPASAATGLRVSGTRVVEANGSAFVMRGTSHAHTWYPNETGSFAGIKAHGANTVRVVLSGGRWTANSAADVADVISLCKQNRLICVLEDHDTTGYGEQSGAYTLDQAVTYWIGLRSVLTGQENHVIINLGNEPIGNNAVTPGWAQATSAAITRMRDAGFQHLLMVDAPAWGQDWKGEMRDNAATVLNADPQKNTVFSVHMYGVYDTAAEINAYLDAFRTAGLPLVIGEFGNMHSDGDPDEDTIMAQAQARGIGYLGWSWSGNGGGVEYLDQVTAFDATRLTAWGERLFNGANGIQATAREATIYGGSTDTSPPTAPAGLAASGVTSAQAGLSWSASTDNVGVTGYDVLRAGATGSFAVVGTSATTSFTATGLSPSTTYRFQVRARDAAGNTSAVSNTVTVATTGGSGGGGCTATYSQVGSWQGGFQGQVAVANGGSTPTTGWTVTLTFADGQKITQIWNARTGQTASPYTIANESHNGAIAAGGTATFGFLGSWNGTNAAPALSCSRTP
ncbi:cellulase family glycosylhydrolase [Nonomuraea sp. NPDC050383]|uniref:cellulase family glycosylhydrolase n=1 Tax=Nonomuraea sp. NPDC050383 TaxID=3364362 RepID=UPI0037916EED